MNRLKKWIRYVPDRIDDGLRYLCGRMSPDVRLVCVVAMLLSLIHISEPTRLRLSVDIHDGIFDIPHRQA